MGPEITGKSPYETQHPKHYITNNLVPWSKITN